MRLFLSYISYQGLLIFNPFRVSRLENLIIAKLIERPIVSFSPFHTLSFITGQPAQVFADNVEFEVDHAAFPEGMEIGMLVSVRDNRYLERIVF